MSQPDMVFNEPIATGWMRTELYGNRDKATDLIFEARVQMGWLRTIYGVNERIAEGEPGGFYHATHTLPDGSTIQVITNDGHDTIRIWAAGGAVQPKRTKISEQKLIDMLICGTCRDEDGHRHAVLWSGGGDPLDLGLLPDCVEAEAMDISEDGQTVVGFCLGTNNRYRAWRWNAAEGMVDLGALNPDYEYMQATAVNADGTVIVGTGYGTNPDYSFTGWVWRATIPIDGTGAFTELPNAGQGMGQGQLVKVSPSGKYIAGSISVPLVGNTNSDGAYWVDGEGPNMIPRPGTTSTRPAGNSQLTESYADPSGPCNVTDAGIITGGTGHSDVITYIVEGQFFGIPQDPATYYLTAIPSTQNVFRYDLVSGEYALIGDGLVTAEADDAGVVIGNQSTGVLVTIRQDFPETNSWLTSTDYANIVNSSWALLPAREAAPPQMVSLGANTTALDISEDGVAIVGISLDTTSAGLHQPLLWLDDGTTTTLDLPYGCVSGKATAVTFATTLDLTTTEDD